MRTGVSYMGHHNPRHIETDLRAMQELGLDDVLVSAQENDFHYFTGKLSFIPPIAKDHGIRPIAIFWGALNLFGGGRSSQFLLAHPEGFQVGRNGEHRPEGCYVNPVCVARIKEMIDRIAESGFEGYFVDEPTPLRDCFCPSCRRRFEQYYGGDLMTAPPEQLEAFRARCVVDYVREIADYCQATYPHLETMSCLMPSDRELWRAMAEVQSLKNLGTDIYWVNNDRDVEEMTPMVRELGAVCRDHGKVHHEWLQCWHVKKEKEQRIVDQGKILVREQPDALYVWAWLGQVGTNESCEDPASAWEKASQVLRMAKDR